MKSFRFLSDANTELFEAVDFYNGHESGVSFRFLDAVNSTIRQIADDPQRDHSTESEFSDGRSTVFHSMSSYFDHESETSS